MVGAVQGVGARPAPLRVLPAGAPVIEAASGPGAKEADPARSTTTPKSTAATRTTTKATSDAGIAGKGGYTTGTEPAWHEAFNIPFIGRMLLMGYNAVKGGQVAAAPAGQLVQALKSFDLEGIWNSGKALGQVGTQFATKSAGFAGAISLVTNGLHVLNHEMTVPVAGARVVGDAIGGAAGGIGGAIAGGLGLTLLGAVGLVGAPLTIGAAVVGFIGYYYADKTVRQTGVYNWIVRNTHDALAGVCRSFGMRV
jgi:hypothetical protein